MSKDALGDRMKEYYEKRTRTYLPRRTNTVIRLDGKAFHSYTRGMKKPFDKELSDAMDNTMLQLCREIQGAVFGYVQSDEISIVLKDYDKLTTDAWFGGAVQKIVSVSASMATGYFNREMYMLEIRKKAENGITNTTEDPTLYMESIFDKLAFFDSRVMTIPQIEEVVNYLIWRQGDAVRNSISMLAQSLYSHKELMHMNTSQMQEMCWQKGKNWNDVDDGWKRGRMAYKSMEFKQFSADEVKKYANTGNLIKIDADTYGVERMIWKLAPASDFIKDGLPIIL